MKFSGGWQVDVVRPNGGRAYADIVQGSERYVVGIPNQPFEVRVTVPSNIFAISPHIRIVLTLDGVEQITCKIIGACSPSATFDGFVNTVSGQHIRSQFLFGQAQSESASANLGNSSVGSVSVRLEQIYQAPGERSPVYHVTANMAKGFQAAEGKKWFTQPSLAAKAGVATGPPVTYTRVNWVAMQTLAVLNLRMETAATLTLRKVLNRNNPVHQAIIQAAEAQEEQIGASASAASRVSTVDAFPRGLKRVKLENTQVSRPIKQKLFPAARGQHLQPEVNDLT